MPDDQTVTARSAAAPVRSDFTVKKGDVSLAVYRKRQESGGAVAPSRPVLFLVHGSSNSALSSFDLAVPGKGEFSTMNVFARLGFDVWTMDHENYGRSSRTEGNSDIKSGVADLIAATDLVVRETGRPGMHFMGESSGALRAAAFAMARPERVERLVLNAFTYTGRNSPTLAKRAEQVEYFRTHNRRLRDRAMIESIFTRDHPGTSDPAVAAALADAELVYGDQVPTGTYLDMTANLPVVDPKKIMAPVLLVRGEHDGIASEEDLLDFYRQLPNPDRQFAVMPGAAHALVFGHNRHQLWHVVHAFLACPSGATGEMAGFRCRANRLPDCNQSDTRMPQSAKRARLARDVQDPTMSDVHTRIHVAADHTITGVAPPDVPPGDHEITITVPPLARQPAKKPFDVNDLPNVDLGPWPEGLSLRREDIYGDDGR